MEFKMETTVTSGGNTVIELGGEVDVYTVPQFKQKIADLRDQGMVSIVVVLTKVDYLDSTALDALIDCRNRCRERDGHMVVVGNSPHVSKVFGITGLSKEFEFADTVEDAERFLAGIATTT